MLMAHTTTQTEAGSRAEQAKEQAKQQAEQVKQQAQQAGGQARDKLREQVDQRSTQAGERVGSAAQDVRSVADELRRQGKGQPAKLAEQAAERAERVGAYLEESDADRILRDVEDIGRRQPWAVVLAGLALGFAASRFLKASSSRRYEERYRSRYESSGRLPVRTTDVSPGPGYVGPGVAGSHVGTTRVGTGDLGATSVGTSDLDAPAVRREPGLNDPAPGRAAEDVSLSGGVMPSGTPGATAPGRRDEELR
jgi:hypothetical protein